MNIVHPNKKGESKPRLDLLVCEKVRMGIGGEVGSWCLDKVEKEEKDN